MAITFDDAPIVRFYTYPSKWHRKEVIDEIVLALDAYDAPATIFVIGEDLKHEEGAELLRLWAGKGVELANHSMTHRNFNELPYEEGCEEIRKTNELLQPFAEQYGEKITYFRFPFLAEGGTPPKKAEWKTCLDEIGLYNAPVSINNYDWEYNARYAEAELSEDWALRHEIGQEYVEHMRSSIAYWDSLAYDLTGRNIRHVLLLHANRINRDYLPQILEELKKQGFEFITLEEAYKDPVYRMKDKWITVAGSEQLGRSE